MPASGTRSVWDSVVGQTRAVEQLVRAAEAPVHAYLFVGPPGCTKDEAARAFAAMLMTGVDDPGLRDARLALDCEHPDVREVERVGAKIAKDQVTEIIRAAALAPVEGRRKVMILHEFHLLDDEGAARLLKTLEEPPPSTVFVVIADQVPPELVTIASRCVRVDFATIGTDVISARLITEGIAADAAMLAAASAEGNLTRARDLANDGALARRRDAFAAVPSRLDGTGARVVAVCRELETLIDAAAEPIAERHARELSDLEARVAAAGERGSGRKQLEERHKREMRRHRTDELRSGLSLIAATYRDAFVDGRLTRHDAAVTAVRRVHEAIEALGRNPNETLLLQALLLELPALPR